ncbi:MAG: phage tail protein [Solirubrobacterales bacterium]
MADRTDPYRNFIFSIEIEGITEAHFTEVRGLEASVDVIEHRGGADLMFHYKLSGLTRFSNVTLRRGTTDSVEFYEWFKGATALGGSVVERKAVTIKALDELGEEKAIWTLAEAWPCKYVASDFNSNGNEIAVEMLELAHEGIERTQ